MNMQICVFGTLLQSGTATVVDRMWWISMDLEILLSLPLVSTIPTIITILFNVCVGHTSLWSLKKKNGEWTVFCLKSSPLTFYFKLQRNKSLSCYYKKKKAIFPHNFQTNRCSSWKYKMHHSVCLRKALSCTFPPPIPGGFNLLHSFNK